MFIVRIGVVPACSKPYSITSPTTGQTYFSGDLGKSLAELGMGRRGTLRLDPLPRKSQAGGAPPAPTPARPLPAVLTLQVRLGMQL